MSDRQMVRGAGIVLNLVAFVLVIVFIAVLAVTLNG